MTFDRYSRVIALACAQPWAILEDTLFAIASLLDLRAAGITLTGADIRARIGGEPRERPPVEQGPVAVLPLFGVMAQRMNMLHEMSGGTSTEAFTHEFETLRDAPDVKAIVIPIDSPGGGIYGMDEAAKVIRDSRGSKPIIAVATSLAASGGYYVGSAADRFVITPGGDVGSIGVLGLHHDLSAAQEKAGVKTTIIASSKYKGEGNPFVPLSEDTQAHLKARIDEADDRFVRAVAEGRRVPISMVRERFGQGRLLGAKDALAAGMVDEIATLDDVIGRLSKRPTKFAVPRAAALAPSDSLSGTSQEPLQATDQDRAADRIRQYEQELALLDL